MARLSTEKPNAPISNTKAVKQKVRAARILPAVVKESSDGSFSYQIGYLPADGTHRKYVPCTRDIFVRERGTADNSADSLALSGKAEYILCLDDTGTCIRLDVIKLLPLLSGGLKADGDPPEDTFKLHYHDETGSYVVEEAPRGTVFRDIEILLNLLDKQDPIQAGTQLNKQLTISEVNPPYIKIRKPVQRKSPM